VLPLRLAPFSRKPASAVLELGVPVVDEDRPASGITAIFDSQQSAVWGVNCALPLPPSALR
jgi:hypothetical protein